MALLREWCNRAILLDHGRILAAGEVDQVATLYESMTSGEQHAPEPPPEEPPEAAHEVAELRPNGGILADGERPGTPG